MTVVSRTTRVVQNARVALFFYCINLVLQFFSRKVFLDYLGADLLGLNTTVQNLLQFLNLAESGIGVASAFALYKPLSVGDRRKINEIVSVQGWLYRCVAYIVLFGSIILMFLFPCLFSKTGIPLLYIYGTFCAFLLNAVLGYLSNYKMTVLLADQKVYKATIQTQGVKSIKILFQMVAISHLSHGYLWWIFFEILAPIATAIRLHLCIKKEYPWLITDVDEGRRLRNSYSFLSKKITQLMFHRIGGYVFTQSTPLIVFYFTSLSIVAVYGNYAFIMGACLMLVDVLSRGFNAGVGNLIAEGNKTKIKQIFWELVTLRLFIAGTVCTGIYLLSEPFVRLWLGDEYVMPAVSMGIMLTVYFIQMTKTCDIFLSAYGLFDDIWAPIVQSVLNLTLSIVFGYFWGLTGIVGGVLVSEIFVTNSWKAVFLFEKGFKDPFWEYAFLYTKKIILLVVVFVITLYIQQLLALQMNNISLWVLNASLVVFVFTVSGTVLFYFLDKSFKSVVRKAMSKLLNG